VDNVRTVSDTKRAFYSLHTRPVHSIYRRVVEELMVEMHLLSVNADFQYDAFYALGVVTTFDQFMQGYVPEADRDSIFTALCQAVGQDAQQYRQDAEYLKTLSADVEASVLVGWLSGQEVLPQSGYVEDQLKAIATSSRFKYSRLFAVGLFTLLDTADAELFKDKDEEKVQAFFQPICECLHLSTDKLKKDLELYRSNLDKIRQAQLLMQEVLESDRKKREQRLQGQQAIDGQEHPEQSDQKSEPEVEEQ
jgi:photosystem II biogenesis protein Psp29